LPIQNSTLLEGFCPLSNWRFNHVQGVTAPIVDFDLENLVIIPYCCPKDMSPLLKIVLPPLGNAF
jgi:hypothetical protein